MVQQDIDKKPTFATAVDELTVRRAQRGDTDAMAAIYQILGKPCYNLAYRMAGSTAVAEDIVHDTFIKVINKIHRYRGPAPLWAWVRQITFNTTINHLNRRKWTAPMAEAEQIENTLEDPAAQSRPLAQLDAETLLAQLTPQARAVVLMHDLEGMTHREIAEVFEQTESFSKSVLFRARKQLKSLIESTDSADHHDT
ncbi:MAG: RNA polymerase sigma factor [Lysobacterales bacterium]